MVTRFNIEIFDFISVQVNFKNLKFFFSFLLLFNFISLFVCVIFSSSSSSLKINAIYTSMLLHICVHISHRSHQGRPL
mgnify:CR=1 FL=1